MASNTSTKSLRILHITKWYPNRNDVQNGVFIEKHIACTARFAEVKVLAWLQGEAKTEIVESIENNLPITRYYFKRKTPVSYKRHAFRDYIRGHYNNKNLPDIIHLHIFSPDLLLAVNWARKRKIPVVISEHWSGYMRGIFESLPYWRKWAYRKLGAVNRILPVSEFLQDHMIESRIKGEYQVLPNVVEENKNRPEKLLGFAFGVVADLVDKIKNVSGIIQAFEQLENPDVVLHIIGGGPDEKMIQERVSYSPKVSQIKLYGRLSNEEVLKLLPSFHCLINNSRVESFGVTILEAHAAGIPVISTRCGGPNEWIEDGDLAIEIEDEKALLQAMTEMIATGSNSEFTKWQACLPENVSAQLKELYLDVAAKD